jgi:hypothetical protein
VAVVVVTRGTKKTNSGMKVNNNSLVYQGLKRKYATQLSFPPRSFGIAFWMLELNLVRVSYQRQL